MASAATTTTTTATTTAAATTAGEVAAEVATSPLMHAIAGSIGSAVALLLFYPLERARIEIQAQQAHQQTHQHTHQQTHQQPQQQQQQDGAPSSESWEPLTPITPTPHGKERTDIPNHNHDHNTDSINSRPTSDGEKSSARKRISSSSTPSSKSSATKVGLIKCLLELHSQGTLYQGVTPVAMTIFTSQFIFFYLHAFIKRFLVSAAGPTTTTTTPTMMDKARTSSASASASTVSSLLSSSLAGMINVLLTNPLWVVNIAIVTGSTKTNHLWKELLHMVQTRGIRHLWTGTSASLLLVSNPVLQFVTYEQLKRYILLTKQKHQYNHNNNNSNNNKKHNYTSLSPLEAFGMGALAKAVATVLTYPLQLAQTILRLQGNDINHNHNHKEEHVDNGHDNVQVQDQAQVQVQVHHYNTSSTTTLQVLLRLYRKGGAAEWFTGMRAKLLQTVLTAAFTFLTYEQILNTVQLVLDRHSNQNQNQNHQPRRQPQPHLPQPLAGPQHR